MIDIPLFKNILFSVFTNIRITIVQYLAYVFGIPKCMCDCVVRVLEIRATLTEDIEIPDMIIIQDYLGTIVEENEEGIGTFISSWIWDIFFSFLFYKKFMVLLQTVDFMKREYRKNSDSKEGTKRV